VLRLLTTVRVVVLVTQLVDGRRSTNLWVQIGHLRVGLGGDRRDGGDHAVSDRARLRAHAVRPARHVPARPIVAVGRDMRLSAGVS
jgi:hypothetical protein